LLRRNLRIGITILFWLGSTATVYAAGIIVPAGSQLLVNTATLKVPGDVSISGILTLTIGTIELTGNWTNSGTFTSGTGTVNFTAGSGTQTLTSGGTGSGKLFYNLTHSGAGTLQLNSNAIDIDGAVTNSAGIFDANGFNIYVAGNWSNSVTFTHGNNTVILDGSNQTLTGSTTFYILIKNVSSAATLTFDYTATQTITNSLTLNGASGQLLSLRSSLDNNRAGITLQSGGTQNLSYLDVKNSDASGGVTLNAGTTSVNSHNNLNWSFGAIILNVWVSDSTFTFGTNPLNTWLTPQTSVIANNGAVVENFVGRISQFTDGANTWGISFSANGVDTTRVQWSTTSETGPWTDISAYNTDYNIATNVAANDSVNFWFRIQTPIGTSSYNEHSSTLTVTAQEY
jgi:hypothetical protein